MKKKSIASLKDENIVSVHEEDDIEKKLSLIFKILLITSVLLNIIVILNGNFLCKGESYSKCGFSYVVYNNQPFFVFMWIENVFSIVLGLYNVIFGGMDKNLKKVILGIFSILIQPIIWVNILMFLNISW